MRQYASPYSKGHVTVALIPARAGSTGLPGKNLLEVGGRSLLVRAIDVAAEVQNIDRVVVSTDGHAIAEVAERAGAEVQMRPPELATSGAVVADAIRYVLRTLRVQGSPATFGVLLEPTSPLRAKDDVSACLEAVREGADSAATFTEASLHPHRAFVIAGGAAEPFVSGAVAWRPRQELKPDAYQLSGGAYAFRCDRFPRHGPAILFGHTVPVIVPRERSLDVDDEMDLRLVDAMLASSSGSTTKE